MQLHITRLFADYFVTMVHLPLWWDVINQLLGGLSPQLPSQSAAIPKRLAEISSSSRTSLRLQVKYVQRALFCLRTPKRPHVLEIITIPLEWLKQREVTEQKDIKEDVGEWGRKRIVWKSIFRTWLLDLLQCDGIPPWRSHRFDLPTAHLHENLCS